MPRRIISKRIYEAMGESCYSPHGPAQVTYEYDYDILFTNPFHQN